MNTSPVERLLIAAKSSEIEQLTRLAETCAVVGDISRFVHALQRERGSTSIYLASAGGRFGQQRQERIAESEAAEDRLRRRLEEWMPPADSHGKPPHPADARLLKNIAAVWRGFEILPALRRESSALNLSADDAMQRYNPLIGNLLSVVFEAADTASDSDVTRVLVCLFHFTQGKELAGQERACGALGFTLGEFDAPHRETLEALIDAQHRCFAIFAEFASVERLEQWQHVLQQPVHAIFAQLRETACQRTEAPAGLADAGEQWYAFATQRIDAMKRIEDHLVEELLDTCQRKIVDARHALHDPKRLENSLHEVFEVSLVHPLMGHAAVRNVEGRGELIGQVMDSRLNRSLIGLIQSQNARLQRLSDELESTRKTLRDRKLIDRAKGLLMTHQSLSEEQAYGLLRKTAMDQSKPLAAVAQSVIELTDLLKQRPPASRT